MKTEISVLSEVTPNYGGSEATGMWSVTSANLLQESVDRIFGTNSQSLLGLDFSFTIADPYLPDCPLIGCSTGFTKLCGYEIDDIVGKKLSLSVRPSAS